MFKAPALVLVGMCLIASPAAAQRAAPITQGVTSSDLSQQVAQARQQSAQVQVEVNGLTGDVMQLTGRVETLEFQLQQLREQNENLSRDNEALIDEAGELRAQIDGQSDDIAAMKAILASAGLLPEADPNRGLSMGEFGTMPNADLNTDPGIDTGPHRLTPTAPGGDVEAQNSPSGPTQLMARSVDASGADLPEGSLGTIPATALPGEAGPLFALAKSRLIQFDYAGAEEAFRAFLNAFGDDPQAGEAHYWLGESLYQQKAYADSGAAYTTMIRSYPDDPRAADALVKLARAMRLIGDKEKACLALGTLPSRYPNASGVTRDLAAVERTKSGCDN